MTEKNNAAMKDSMESIPQAKREPGQHLMYRMLCMEEMLSGMKVTKTVLSEWGLRLKGCDVADIEYAFKGLSCGKFFPSITEFKRLARISMDHRHQKKLAEDRRKIEATERKRIAADKNKISAAKARAVLQGEGDMGKAIFRLWYRHKLDRIPGDITPEDGAREYAKDLQAFFIEHKLPGFDYEEEYQYRKKAIIISRESLKKRTNIGKPMLPAETEQKLLTENRG